MNAFQVDEKIELEQLKVDPAIEQGQRQRLAYLRQHRNSEHVNELLSYLAAAAQGKDNLVPLLIECVENEITLGEICNTLRDAWGEYEPPAWI